jgi:formate dehydrogenase iron-sulfur subunit
MSGAGVTDKTKGILTDVTKCIGCERCVEGCVQQNKLPADIPTHYKAEDGLSSRRFTSIVRVKGKGGKWRNIRRQCMHCNEPSCAAACLVGAFTKSPDGGVVYDDSKCIGCRYCMLACPFVIPRYEFDKPLPLVRKCKMSDECRVEGGAPACVAACPTGATVFGPREKLIEEARRRIAEKPDLYIDHIYGEHELGGTSVMYVSDVPLNEVLRVPTEEELRKRRVRALAKSSIPAMLEGWVYVTPVQFAAVSAGLAGGWFLRRRSKLMAEKARADAEKRAKTPHDGSEG